MPWSAGSEELYYEPDLTNREAPGRDDDGPEVEAGAPFEGREEPDGEGDGGPDGDGCEGYEDAEWC